MASGSDSIGSILESKGKKSKPNDKKPRNGNPTLEEIKRRGRQLRSAHKDGGLLGLYGGLTLEDFAGQPQGVGLVYDERMLQHHCTWDEKFPEKAARVSLPYLRCQHYGLVDRCKRIPARSALDEEVLMCHSSEWLETMKRTAEMSEEELKEISSKYDGVYFHKTTYECSMLALGSTIELVDKVCDRDVRHGMAIVRPPGHHAMFDEACGYCFFNNVAVAAEHALRYHSLQRILIIDWDVHHGQGTQYAFYDDPRVLYFSIHRYEHGNFWPNLRQSEYDKIGEGEGRGYNVNVPLNKTQMTNGDYFAILTQILLPIANEFNPQLVLVSAGFDSAIGCPEGENLVTPAMFAHFVNLLKTLAHGKLALILEGGYCLKSLSESVAMCLRALLDDPCPSVSPLDPPSESIVSTILHVVQQLRHYWRSLAYQGVSEDDHIDIWTRHPTPDHVDFATEQNRPEKFDIVGDYIIHTAEKERELDVEIDRLIANTDLTTTPNRTCIVYDEKMRAHKCTSMGSHPERPDRIRAIYDKHVECGIAERCKELESRNATDEDLLLVHTADHLDQVKAYQDIPQGDLHDMEIKLNSVYLTQEAYQCANLAVGCMLQTVDEVCTGQSLNGVAIIRPPGHHAEPHEACGFCYFNTVAVAARYAQQKYNLQRVLILDWDIHHGNGTQHMFWNDPSVLYISLHRYDHGFFFPAGEDGNVDQVGELEGEGYNVNIPWNTTCGDAEYIAAFQQIVLPIAYEFAPDLVLVSAGFDAAKGDPLGGYKITPEGYAHLTQMLTGLAGGRVIVALEGGYNLHSISESMVMCTSMLLGDTCPLLPKPNVVPTEGGVQTIRNVINTQKRYWKSLQFGVDLPLTSEQKDVLMAAGDIAFKNIGIDGVTKGLEALSVSPLPTAAEVYSAESSSSSSEDSPQAARQSDQPTPTTAMDQSQAEKPDVGPSGQGEGEGTPPQEGSGSGQEAGGSGSNGAQGAAGGSDQENLTMYTVVPLTWCPHLEDGVATLPARGLHVKDPCMECEYVGECWVCLRCYEVHCGRYINEHMLMHGLETEHPLVLSYADLSVWCYPCESYVHHPSLQSAKRAAHLDKFGSEPGV